MKLSALRMAADTAARPIRSALSRSSLKGRELARSGSPASFDRNFPRARKPKAWDSQDREKFFRDKYAHVHAKQKAANAGAEERRRERGGRGEYQGRSSGSSSSSSRRSHDEFAPERKSKNAFARVKPVRHTEYVYGKSAVEAALRNPLRSEGHAKLFVLGGIQNLNEEVVRLAKGLNIPVDKDCSRWDLNRMTSDGVHNGYALKTRPLNLTEIESLGDWAIEEGPESEIAEDAKGASTASNTTDATAVTEEPTTAPEAEDAIEFLAEEDMEEDIFDTRPKTYSIHTFSPYSRHIEKHAVPVIAPNIKPNALGIYIDQVTDPHNIGAILRSAYFLGADFAILSELNCAKLSPVAAKSAAGAVDSLPIYTCDAPLKLFEKSAAAGWNIIATVPPTTTVSTAQRVNYRDLPVLGAAGQPGGGPCLLAVGSESEGLRKSLLQRCTHVVSIPKAVERNSKDGDVVESLNVSVATALLISNFMLN